MAKEQEEGLNILLFGFIILIIGILLSVALADQIEAATEVTTETAESIAIGFNTVSVQGESITLVSNNGTTVFTDVLNVLFFGNGSVNTSDVTINVNTEVNFTNAGVITTSVNNFSNGVYVINYTRNVANGSTENANVVAVSFFGNSTINTTNANINVNTHVNFTLPGVITVSGRNFTNDTYSITYDYQGTDYVVDSGSRTIVNLIPLFYIIGILLVGVGISMRMGLLAGL